MEIFIIIALIIVNGIFSMSEMALVSSKKYKLETASKRGFSNAKTALRLAGNPNKFLSTVQIGITLTGILIGIFSGDKLIADLEKQILHFRISADYVHGIASFLVVFIITFISIVFGELIPKRLGLKFPEKISMFIAKPMYLLSAIASPFVWLLTVTNNFFLKIFGIYNDQKETITEEEIKSLIKEGSEGGVIEDKEHDILRNAFDLGNRKVNSIVTHRTKIIALDLLDDCNTVKQKIKNASFSTYPVTENGNIDQIVGIVKMKDLFDFCDDGFALADHVNKTIFVSENSFIYPLLQSFQDSKSHIAVVIDEFGNTKGIVTLNDILDDLVGTVTHEMDTEPEIIQRSENSWLIDGKCTIYDFKKYFETEVDEEIETQFISVSGLFFNESEGIPKTGDVIRVGNLSLEIVDKDGNRVDKILATKIEETPEDI
ncbi:hemolysin family protein [Chryseobacterium caseinilyticum]|uniref:HlyC/CorC family transporter n=1 Tax=Chryseobacterium caseinilyticum TaxID=2771428 RepID=A0ABR8ZAT8_9FLAO|nr:hemolysin family protein [Chryseobacterium caseinilyticum]MBD8082015.1 HlyC/CorC family transporter [Chryseobacterium caseinilyticum]